MKDFFDLLLPSVFYCDGQPSVGHPIVVVALCCRQKLKKRRWSTMMNASGCVLELDEKSVVVGDDNFSASPFLVIIMDRGSARLQIPLAAQLNCHMKLSPIFCPAGSHRRNECEVMQTQRSLHWW